MSKSKPPFQSINMSTRPPFLQDSFVPTLFKQVTSAVSSSQKLPSADEQAYLQFSREFAPTIGALRSHAKGLLMRLVKLVNPQSGGASYDDVVDACDECLENVSLGLDSHSPDSLRTQLSLLSPHQLLRYDYPFLQDRDNSQAPFVPRLTCKPNAKIPLDPALLALQRRPDLLKPYGKNPYQYEIEQLPLSEAYKELKEAQPPLPLEATPYEFISTSNQLQALIGYLSSVSELAIDLEHHSIRSYQGLVCLMQISTRDRDFIVDPLTLWSELPALLDIFTNPAIVKVFHGADSDVIWLQRDFGLYIVNMFDTGQAARELQLPSFSLAYLLKRMCQVDTDKSFQLADWRVRPLSTAMVKYARIDTHYLLYIYDRLKAELAVKGRELHKDPSALINAVFLRSKDVSLKVYMKADHTYMGIRRLGTLGYGSKRVLEALAQWRDTLARRLDESPSFLIAGEAVVLLAATLPSSEEELLSRIRRPSPLLTTDRVKELLAIIAPYRETNVPVPVPSPASQPPSFSISPAHLLVSTLLQTTPTVAVTVASSKGLPSSSWTHFFDRKLPRPNVKSAVEQIRKAFESLMQPVVKCQEGDMVEVSGEEAGLAEEKAEVVQPSTSEFIKLPPAPMPLPLPLKRKTRDRNTVHVVPDTPALLPAPKLKLELTDIKPEPKPTKRRKLLRPPKV